MADIKTKDGIIVRGIPEGQERSDAIKSYVANIRATQGAGEYNFSQTPQNAPSSQQPGTPQSIATDSFPGQQQEPIQEQSMLQRAGQDFKGGLDATIRGAVPLLTAEMVSTPIVDTINKMLGTNFERPADGMRAILERAGVEAPQNKAEEIVQTMSETILETMATMGAGTAMQAGKGLAQTGAKAIGQTLASQPAQQIAGAAGSAAASKVAEQKGVGVGGQLAAGLVGGVAGSGLSNLKATPLPKLPINEAKQAGVRLLTSDVRPPRTAIGKIGQSVAEKIPVVGTGLTRKAQQAERVLATKDLLRQFGADDAANISDDIMDDLLKTRQGQLNKYATAKNEVIEKLSGESIPVNKTIASIDDQIAKLESLKTQEVSPVIEKLNDWKTAVQDQDLQNIETLRKQMGESFKGQDMASVRSTGEKSLSSIYKSINEDMGNYIKNNGDAKDFTKWKASNKSLSNMIGELDKGALKTVLNKGTETPEVVKNLLFSKKESDVRSLFKNLSPTGQSRARTAILAKAAEGSQFLDSDSISPDKFANAVKKLGNQTGVFFSGDDLKQVEGLMKVLNTTRRAGVAAAAPPTGQQLLPFALASSGAGLGEALGIGAIPGSIATALTTGAIANLYESRAVRNILMKLPTVAAGSAQEAALFKRLAETARAVKGAEEKEGK